MKKCRYCDFLSFPCSDEKAISEYASALIMEIRSRYEEWPYKVVDSIYIGGGTPSLMPSKDIKRIMAAINENFLVDENSEITIEANPATLTDEKLSDYLECGINRISIGVQSFDNSILRMLGRVHDKNDALNAIRMAKKAGFDNINVDLMFGIPNQSMKMWKDSVKQAAFLGPQHVSMYSLQIEEGTPFYEMVYVNKNIEPLPEATDRAMYHEAIEIMAQHGYSLYEISNACLPGFESRHNLKYWDYENYLGLGPGASSFMDGHRFKNCSTIPEYLKYIKAGLAPVKPEDVENYSLREEMGIYVFTGLRKTSGFSISDFEKTFGTDFFNVYDPKFIDKFKGLLEYEGERLRLTPEGFDVSNQVMAEFV